jgi:hypothetical protein
MPASTRANDFRYVFSSAARIQFTANDVTIIHGIKEDQSSTEDAFYEQVGIISAHGSAKLLAHTLTRIIQHYEWSNAVVIPLDQTKVESLENVLKALAENVLATSPNASQLPPWQSLPTVSGSGSEPEPD